MVDRESPTRIIITKGVLLSYPYQFRGFIGVEIMYGTLGYAYAYVKEYDSESLWEGEYNTVENNIASCRFKRVKEKYPAVVTDCRYPVLRKKMEEVLDSLSFRFEYYVTYLKRYGL